jgi:hypothetical protein
MFMSDEAHFYVTGDVNRSYVIAPLIIRDNFIKKTIPFAQSNSSVCCFIVHHCGPAFFENENGEENRVTADPFTNMLRKLRLDLRKWKTSRNYGFSKTGINPRRQKKNTAALIEIFPGRLKSRFGNIR